MTIEDILPEAENDNTVPPPSKQPACFISRCLSMLPLDRFRQPTIAVIQLAGVIGHGKSLSSPMINLDAFGDQIEAAFKLPRLKAVALCINSPGGSPVQTELVYKRIRMLADEKHIPVLSFAESVAASGGYWLACAGDEIFASENSIIGSIGVIAAGFGFQEAIQKIGVERRVYTQGENKSILDPFKPEKEADVKIIHSLQKDIHESFKNLVRSRRADKLKGSEKALFNGEFWTGKRALEHGLIDGIGDFYSVIKERYGDKVTIKKMKTKKGFVKQLLGMEFGMAGLVDTLLDRIEARLMWNRFDL